MADIVVTEATCVPDAAAKSFDRNQIPGEALTVGEVVCIKDATVGGKTVKRVYGAQCDVDADKVAFGLCVTKALAAEQKVIIQTGDSITIPGAAMAPGQTYYLSANKGAFCPFADLVTGNNVVRIGEALSATVLSIDIKDMGFKL